MNNPQSIWTRNHYRRITFRIQLPTMIYRAEELSLDEYHQHQKFVTFRSILYDICGFGNNDIQKSI